MVCRRNTSAEGMGFIKFIESELQGASGKLQVPLLLICLPALSVVGRGDRKGLGQEEKGDPTFVT